MARPTGKEYRISSLNDVFEHVPTDRVHACMRELAVLIRMSQGMVDLFPDDTFNFPAVIIWTDDGIKRIDYQMEVKETNDAGTNAESTDQRS